MSKNELIRRFAQEPQDVFLMAQILDKKEEAERKNILVHTRFLNADQQLLAERMLQYAGARNCFFYGGYEDAERRLLIFCPDYWEAGYEITDELSPLSVIRATYAKAESLSHRDFLGSLMALGIARETVGDILVGSINCDFIVLKEIAPYVLANLETVGRVKVKTERLGAGELQISEQKYKLIKDTVATVRLDSIVAAGFALGRDKAKGLVETGRVVLNHRPCSKADKAVTEGDVISIQGFGKILVQQIGSQTKKGRTAILIKKLI